MESGYKFRSTDFYKDYSNRTEGSLRREIASQTKKLNARLADFDWSAQGSNFVKQSVYRINLLSGMEREEALESTSVAGGVYLQQGRRRTVIKRERESLIRQARELKSFLNWDIYTPEGKRLLAERENKAFKQFVENSSSEYEDTTKQQWLDMVEAFGAIGSDIITEVTSDDYVRAYQEASETGKIKFVDIYKELENEYKALGKSPKDSKLRYTFISDFKERLKTYKS